MYNKIVIVIKAGFIGAVLAGCPLQAGDSFPRWIVWADMGGTIPENPAVTEFPGSANGGEMSLSPGFQMDLGAGYRVTEWLSVGPELGFTFNGVDSIGNWSCPNTTLGQVLMMADVRFEYPPKCRLAPFVGAGIGGAASFMTFYDNDYYSYDYPDGTGSDFVLAFQAFGGLRYRFSESASLGVEYRFLATQDQRWNIDWWSGNDFTIGTSGIRMHSVCLIFSQEF